MFKFKELTEGCIAKAHDLEMTFVLIARDECAPNTIRDWCKRRIKKGLNEPNDPKILEALACANTMEHQQKLDPVWKRLTRKRLRSSHEDAGKRTRKGKVGR